MADDKLRIFMNTNITMSRGKYAAHAVHAALTAFGVHPDIPVVVLGAKPRDIEAMRVSIHDHGTTELEPGTLTAGTDYVPQRDDEARMDLANAIGSDLITNLPAALSIADRLIAAGWKRA
jgi:PTH2 family peptidyl-tRNA hydrolase